eukprot:1172145-Prorocentrum_minimum.AAC.4
MNPSLDARKAQNQTKSEEYQRHLQSVLYREGARRGGTRGGVPGDHGGGVTVQGRHDAVHGGAELGEGALLEEEVGRDRVAGDHLGGQIGGQIGDHIGRHRGCHQGVTRGCRWVPVGACPRGELERTGGVCWRTQGIHLGTRGVISSTARDRVAADHLGGQIGGHQGVKQGVTSRTSDMVWVSKLEHGIWFLGAPVDARRCGHIGRAHRTGTRPAVQHGELRI